MLQFNEQLEYILSRFGEYATVKVFDKNELIFNESDVTENIYLIKSGKVEVFKLTKSWEERLLFILAKGSILNEEILFSESSKCSTCCRAFDNTQVVIIPKSVILREMKTDFKLVEHIFSSQSLKLKRTYRQLKNSGTNVTINKKVASKLWKLSLDYGIETKNGIFIDISLSSSVISKMVGAKRETVSRCLNTFKKEGVIKIEGDSITILKTDILKEIFEQE